MSNVPEVAADAQRVTLFLSYARADRPRAQALAEALGKAGFEVWWDVLIEGGAKFAMMIGNALEKADAVVVLWSAHSITSDWVCDEAGQGRARHRLVPLSLDGSPPPLGFRQYHSIDLRRWNGRADAVEIDAIRRAVASALGKEAPPKRETALPLSRRRAMAIAGGVGASIIGGGLVAWQSGLFGPAPVAARSIAVLPFKNLSGDPQQSFFSDGLTEEIRAALARTAGLKVLAATSSNTMRDNQDDAQTVARKLGVAYLLEGSIRRSNDMVRISTNLTDGRTGFSQWSQSLDRKITDIFAVESEIARLVTAALSIRLATEAPAPGGTRTIAALEAYLRGRALFNQAKDEATDRAALAQYDLAIAADPNFAQAHAGRSRALAAIASQHAKADELQSLYTASVAAARRAIELAPQLAEGHLALGYVLYTGKLDIKAARPSFDRAYALGRGNADTILLFALYCARAGRANEARNAIERAMALDPLNPRTFRAAGSIDYAARRYEQALAPLRQALRMNPSMANAHSLVGASLLQLGKLKEARAEFEAEPHDVFQLSGLAIVDRKLGNSASAKRYFDRLVTEIDDAALYQQAEVLAQWGDLDAAMTTLERARDIGDSGLIYLSTDPLLDPLRGQPRFKKLLGELGMA